jgi:alanyl-tRNA synthetase
MRSEEIRRRFLAHFEARDHTVVPSASLIATDPTLLLVNAGMVPFKPYFLGEQTPPYPRAASVQKVVRTVDIDNVGVTTRHNSFFQMCGNFSFGDYFKERAIPLAWELLTSSLDDGGYGLDPERVWATVYLDDDEAYDHWRRILPAERIQRRGKEDNFWSMGVPGPCGPCSEIYYDRGPEHGAEGGPIADENRYLEVWNLVFMQFERGPGSGYDYPILGDLPAKNIDTGLGLERMAVVLQDVDNVYETDLLRPVLDRAQELTGTRYGDAAGSDVALRVVAEHARTVTMLVADGVTPGNEGRGYVLRRMLRRVVRSSRTLGADVPVAADLAGVVRDAMSPSYPEVARDFERIAAVLAAEEQSFLATLRTGTTLFDSAVREARESGRAALSGERAFALHDTYGFPVELTLEMAAEQGLTVDEAGFRELMSQQRRRAKSDAERRKTGGVDVGVYRALREPGATQFTGYIEVVTESRVRGLLRDGEKVRAAGAGEEVELVLDVTPFYAEGGGQQADQGRIEIHGEAGTSEVEVLDVQSPLPGLSVHRVRVLSGEVTEGAPGLARVDVERRRSVSRAHTATHLVHRAFRRALGETATQAGSLNAPGRFRFDFASPTAVPASVLADVEAEVNAVLLDDLEVRAFVTSQDEARRIGAMMLFGEKYGDEVRVVEVGDYARELCGGTHANRSGQLGVVKLLGEASIGAGVRRVEALVGSDAYSFLAREHLLLASLTETLKVPSEQVPDRVAALVSRLREVERELDTVRSAAVLAGAGALAAEARDVFGVAVVAVEAPSGTKPEDARGLALEVRGRIAPAHPAVVVVGTRGEGRAQLVAAVNETGRAWGLGAGDLIRSLAPALGGGGGGRDDVAQGGGPQVEGLADALASVESVVAARVTGAG